MNLQELYGISLYVGLIAYSILTIFCIVNWLRDITGRALLAASAMTLAFIVSLVLGTPEALSRSLELFVMLAWTFLLSRILEIDLKDFAATARHPVARSIGLSAILVLAGSIYVWSLPEITFHTQNTPITWVYIVALLTCVIGLVVLEQVVRNTREDLRWRLRYLNIGLGTVFGFGVVHHASGLMFSAHIPTLVVLQPTVLALATPFIAIASLRNRRNRLSLNVSRQFVFRSGVLIVTGAFLVSMAVAGYYVRMFGGDLGTVLVVLIATLGILALFVAFGSTRVRTYLRLFINENLYQLKYDYRDEWLRVTQQLTKPNPDFDLSQQAIRALMGVLNASGGALWRLTAEQTLIHVSELKTTWQQPLTRDLARQLVAFFMEREWIIDLDNVPMEAKAQITDIGDLQEIYDLRFLVPLFVEEDLFGIIALSRPPVHRKLNWEDYDVVKLIARQAAGLLALRQADEVLSQSKQLHTLNRLSAFVVHDIRTTTSQLSLLLENAQKHKDNPAFIDDMLETVDNSVSRMSKLLTQLKEHQIDQKESVELVALTRSIVDRYQLQNPKPVFRCQLTSLHALADTERLSSTIGHVVQNAIDATPDNGSITVQLTQRKDWLELLIEDNGNGMEKKFIDKKLFQPFESTKGLTGMGIGAYQTREYFRSLGGDVQVRSELGKGTRFMLRLPTVTGFG
ncbi:MAG: PEP-CTERM system histidine kinase PrsK [Gammaproteobacteria bacterium]|nr:PEP-CTERM system histidine kinase PrsK [Gammaproteobacteria bacterium]